MCTCYNWHYTEKAIKQCALVTSDISQGMVLNNERLLPQKFHKGGSYSMCACYFRYFTRNGFKQCALVTSGISQGIGLTNVRLLLQVFHKESV
jgi:hypothetical protein